MSYYHRISGASDYTKPLADAIVFFESELTKAEEELKARGRIEELQRKIPAQVQQRFNQLQEIEAILQFFEIQYDRVRGREYKRFLTNFDRVLTSRDAERFADCEEDVINLRVLINTIALIRNKYLGITKGLESLHYQLTSIVRLRVAGLEDASL